MENTSNQSFDISKALERHKSKLLDLGKTNQLINFRYFKRSTIKVIDEIPTEIFKDMVGNGKTFDFLQLEETEEDHELEIALKSVKYKQYDKKNLPSKHTDTSLQTKLSSKDLQLNLKTIDSKSREFIDETTGVRSEYSFDNFA